MWRAGMGGAADGAPVGCAGMSMTAAWWAGGPILAAAGVPASDGPGGGGAGGRVAAGAPVLRASRVVWQMARAGTVVGVPGAAASWPGRWQEAEAAPGGLSPGGARSA